MKKYLIIPIALLAITVMGCNDNAKNNGSECTAQQSLLTGCTPSFSGQPGTQNPGTTGNPSTNPGTGGGTPGAAAAILSTTIHVSTDKSSGLTEVMMLHQKGNSIIELVGFEQATRNGKIAFEGLTVMEANAQGLPLESYMYDNDCKGQIPSLSAEYTYSQQGVAIEASMTQYDEHGNVVDQQTLDLTAFGGSTFQPSGTDADPTMTFDQQHCQKTINTATHQRIECDDGLAATTTDTYINTTQFHNLDYCTVNPLTLVQ
jgi:hypothetical protein